MVMARVALIAEAIFMVAVLIKVKTGPMICLHIATFI